MAVEIIRRSKKNVARPVKRDAEDGDRRIREHNVTPEPAGLEASQYTIPVWTDNITFINAHSTT